MKPYYQDEKAGIAIYHGDCLDVMPQITADVLITDPPYGIDLGAPGKDKRGGSHGLSRRASPYAGYEDTYENFKSVVVPALVAAISRTSRAAIFIGPHLWDMPPADALGGIYNPAACGRHKWGFKTFLPILFYGTCPTTAQGKGGRPITFQSAAIAEKHGHPCPKPYQWMSWLVGRATLEGEVVLDPFCGSGTTLVAAKNLGRKAIGIEVSEAYCELSAKRLSQEVFDFTEVA